MERKIESRQLLNIITLFAIVQFSGFLITIYALGPVELYAAPVVQPSASVATAITYMFYIIATAIVIILLIRLVKGDIIFILLEAFVVLFATAFLLFILLSSALPDLSYLYAGAAAAIITLLLIIAKNFKPSLRNFIAITSSIGVGVVIGLNGFNIAYILLLLIAIYDYIAVFITKHMLVLAKAVSSRNLAFLIGSSDIEAIPKKYVTAKDRAEFKKSVDMKDVKDPTIRQLVESGAIPVISQVQLGTGDLALPLTLTVSAYVSFLNYLIPTMIIFGSICGMIFTMYLLKKYRVALPAIPPIFAFINLFLSIAFAATKTSQWQLWIGFFLVFVITLVILLSKLRRNGT